MKPAHVVAIVIGVGLLAGLAWYFLESNKGSAPLPPAPPTTGGGKVLDQRVYTSTGPAPGKDALGNIGGGATTLGGYLAGIFGKES